MTYRTYNKKVEKISEIIQKNKKLITTGRKGHNHRDLQFKNSQKKINTTHSLIP